MSQNPMRLIKIEKIVLNIGIGEPGPAVDRAKKVLSVISGRTKDKIRSTRTKRRTTFGHSKGREIGVAVTLRGAKARKVLGQLLKAKEFLSSKSFCQGNFSFGIEEHIDIPGIDYDPKIGIWGLDCCVSLERPGFRIARRKLSKPIGKKHLITKKETIEWFKKNFDLPIK